MYIFEQGQAGLWSAARFVIILVTIKCKPKRLKSMMRVIILPKRLYKGPKGKLRFKIALI